MAYLKGITIKLYEKHLIDKDPFGNSVYEEIPVEVENVLISPASSQDVSHTLSVDGKKAEYVLAIPKGDQHEWENSIIEFFGEKWRSFGIVTQGIEDLIPLDWNKKVQVERYE